MNQKNIAIIGAGSMGQCLLGGLIKNDYPPTKLWITNKTAAKLTFLQKKYAIHTTSSNLEAALHADIIIFAIKPAIIPDVIAELKTCIHERQPLIISVAAGISVASILQGLDSNLPIIRCMPNIPSLIGVGATALFANAFTTAVEKNSAESIFRTVGITVWLEDEKLMNPVTALSGCGPAYFFSLIDILQSAGEKLGLPKDVARLLTLQTAYGACRLAFESEKEAKTLVSEVASPGGSTEEALRVLEDHQLRDIFYAALLAATNKAKDREMQLAKAMEQKQ